MAMRLNGDPEAMAACSLPKQSLPQQQQQQQQHQQQIALPMSFPVSYPFMDAQQLQQYYIAQMQQPQPPMGPNVFVQPWYICQQPPCHSYGYCYGMQMPPNSIQPQNFNAPRNTASIQSAGTLHNSTGHGSGTAQTRSMHKVQLQKPEHHNRTLAGGRTYNQCSVPLPETANGWCGSLNSFEDASTQCTECKRIGARDMYPASNHQMQIHEERRRQQQLQPKLIKEVVKEPLKDPLKEPQREEPPNHSKKQQKIDAESYSSKDSQKEQKPDPDKEPKHSPKKHHKKDIKPEKLKDDIKPEKLKEDIKPEKLKEDIDSALGSGASSFIKRLGDLMRHRSTWNPTKRKQPKGKSTPTITPDSSIISAPPRKPSFFKRLFGEVRDNDVAFYEQSKIKSRCNIRYPTMPQSDSVEQTEAFNKLRRKQLIAAKGPYHKSHK